MPSRKRVKKGKKRGSYLANSRVKKAIIKSLQDGSTVAAACASSKISRDSFYRWYKEDQPFRKGVEQALESRIHHMEDALYKNGIGGDFKAQSFFLCNRAAARWKNTTRIDHAGSLTVKSLITDEGVPE